MLIYFIIVIISVSSLLLLLWTTIMTIIFFVVKETNVNKKKNLIRLHKNTPKIIHGNRYTPIHTHLITKMRTGSIFFVIFFCYFLLMILFTLTMTMMITRKHSTAPRYTNKQRFFLHLTIEKNENKNKKIYLVWRMIYNFQGV